MCILCMDGPCVLDEGCGLGLAAACLARPLQCSELLLFAPACRDQIQAVLDADLAAPLVNLLLTAEFDIRKEAAWAISNATSGGTADQIRTLVDAGCIKPLVGSVTCPCHACNCAVAHAHGWSVLLPPLTPAHWLLSPPLALPHWHRA